MLLASSLYVAAAAAVMLWMGVAPTPDFLLAALAPAVLLGGRFPAWIRDWAPFAVVLLLWDGLRSLADRFALTGVHGGGLAWDRAIFGDPIPSIALQRAAEAAGLARPLDLAGTAVDLGHFPGIFAFALVIWLKDRRAFRTYAKALFATAFAALVVFLAWPTAPPWYAAEQGQLEGLRHVMASVLSVQWRGFYQQIEPNPVAALPSLHAALPLLAYLTLRRLRSRLAWVALAWTLAVWVSVVYLGEHYVADVVAGTAFAAASWVVITVRPWARPRAARRAPAVTTPARTT